MKAHFATMASSLPMLLATFVLAACSASPSGRTDAPPSAPVLPDAGTPARSNLALARGIPCLGEESVENRHGRGEKQPPGAASES